MRNDFSLIKGSGFRYIISGCFFSLLGPALFWYAYGIVGPLTAIIGVETVVHCLRYKVYKRFVFSRKRGFSVGKRKYVISNLPIIMFSILLVRVLGGSLGREALTMIVAVGSSVVGYGLSRWMYTK